jgi:hypothetical protein
MGLRVQPYATTEPEYSGCILTKENEMSFVKAVRKQAKLRLALTGPSGSGKTYSALLLAKGFGGKVAVIDTEHGSASLYCHLLDFDVMELTAPYSPERYIAAIKDAEDAGYDVLVIDSISHEWNGTGGMLQINEQVAKAKFQGNTWAAWSESDPRHRKFIDAMLQSNMHVIVTMRSKTETAQSKDERTGKSKVQQLGMKAEQRDGIIYEFTTVLDIVHGEHYATATKDRTGVFIGDPQVITQDTTKSLLAWLATGVEVLPNDSPPPKVEDDGFWIDDVKLAMRECSDIDGLKSIFGAAYKQANKAQKDDLKAAYDILKDQLTVKA